LAVTDTTAAMTRESSVNRTVEASLPTLQRLVVQKLTHDVVPPLVAHWLVGDVVETQLLAYVVVPPLATVAVSQDVQPVSMYIADEDVALLPNGWALVGSRGGLQAFAVVDVDAQM